MLKFSAKRLFNMAISQPKAMHSLHGSIAAGSYCASAAIAPSLSQRNAAWTPNLKTRPRTKGYEAVMAYVNTNTRSDSLSFRDLIASPLQSLQLMAQRRRVYNQTVYELNGLSDRDLADLGLHRSMISAVAKDAAYGK
jgi:uncharacterized protein YjiS (DUF1127 family)